MVVFEDRLCILEFQTLCTVCKRIFIFASVEPSKERQADNVSWCTVNRSITFLFFIFFSFMPCVFTPSPVFR